MHELKTNPGLIMLLLQVEMHHKKMNLPMHIYRTQSFLSMILNETTLRCSLRHGSYDHHALCQRSGGHHPRQHLHGS